MGHRSLRLGLALTATMMLACISPSDPLGREEALQEIQKNYTDLIRWGEVERAVRYVEPARQAAFLALADDFELLRITDFEIGDLGMQGEFAPEAEAPTREEDREVFNITVTYKGYLVSQMIERTVLEKQQWYRDSIYNTWLVRPDLAGVLRGIRGETQPTAEAAPVSPATPVAQAR